MIVHVAIIKAENVPGLNGELYARLPGTGNLVAPVLSTGHAILATCGTAIRDHAEKIAAELPGATVLTLDIPGSHWPNRHEIESAIIASGATA